MTKHLCAHLWSTYLIPRVVHGLEVQKLSRTDMESLEKFQRKCLRQIQGLPDNTPNCVTLSPLDIPPVELLISILPKNHAGPVEKLISDFFRMPKKVGAIDSL